MRKWRRINLVYAQLSDGKLLVQAFDHGDKRWQQQYDQWEEMRISGESISGSQIAVVASNPALLDPDDFMWERTTKLEVDFSEAVDRLINEV